MIRPLVLLVVQPRTNKIVAIYCAIGQAAQHKLYELLKVRENMLNQEQDIINIMDFNEVCATKIEDQGIYKLSESMVKGKLEKHWRKT